MAAVAMDTQSTWVFGVDKAPPSLSVRERVQPALQFVTGDDGIPAFFDSINDLDTVGKLCTEITAQTIKVKARGVIRPATLKSLAKIIDPSGGFEWPAAPSTDNEKKKRGGNGNNAPSKTLEEQLKDEGVHPLDPATFAWGKDVFNGVPKKGQAPSLNPFINTLFDNTWLAMQKARTISPQCALALCSNKYNPF